MEQTHDGVLDVIRATGDPDRRGEVYGAAARAKIHGAITGYAAVFQHYASWSWPTVQRHALRFSAPIEDFSPSTAREIRGIARGAGVEVADILALNTRSEIMFATPGPKGREVAATECTSFALASDRTELRQPLMGQNWDWIEQARRTSVVLEVRRDDGPDFVTVVEAGMVAKVGVNSSGVGLCTNTLISDGDEGRIAVPYHVLLRSVLDSDSGAEAVGRIEVTPRANSANYLVADDSGFCVDLETAPDKSARIEPQRGTITHANHFLVAGLTGTDRYLERKTHTRNRLDHLARRVDEVPHHTVESLREALADHSDAPSSVCQHPNPELPEAERTCTVAGVVVEVAARRLHYTSGNPCESAWSHHELGVSG
jgi:isopenicillin-N N-acyltransferase-like protein